MDSTLADLVTFHQGVVTSRDLAAWGVSRSTLDRALADGTVIRVACGAYVSPLPGATADARHRRLLRAALAVAPADAVASHQSALVRWNLPTVAIDPDIAHLARFRKPRACSTRGVHWHRLPCGTPLDESDPIRATSVSPAVAVVQVALTSARAGIVAADAVLRRDAVGHVGGATRDNLDDALALYRTARGRTGAGVVVGMADARAESPMESVLRYELALLGYRAEPQFLVPVDGHAFRADLRLLGENVLVEYDGDGKYEDVPAGADPQVWRRRVRLAERDRENALRRVGWRIARFTKRDLGHPGRLRRGLVDAR